jgi:hypothetical protein
MGERSLRVVHRAVIVLALIWIVGFYLAASAAIRLSWASGWSTPHSRAITMCSDMYSPGDKRLIDCDYAGPGSWSDKYLANQRGEPVPWRYYAAENNHPSLWLWWLGVPVALLMLTPLFAWVFSPLRDAERPDESGVGPH